MVIVSGFISSFFISSSNFDTYFESMPNIRKVSNASTCSGSPSGSCSGCKALVRFKQKSTPFRRTPRPKSCIISEPLLFPTFIRHIVDTRHEDQPSVNFLAPISKLTVDVSSFTLSNRDAPSVKSVARISAKPWHALITSAGLPTFITPNGRCSLWAV